MPPTGVFVIGRPSACWASASATQSFRQVENLACGENSRAIGRAGVPSDQWVFVKFMLSHRARFPPISQIDFPVASFIVILLAISVRRWPASDSRSGTHLTKAA